MFTQSRCIPIADYVERMGCGKVVDSVDPASIVAAIEALADEYGNLQEVAHQVGPRDFSQQAMITSYQKVYERIMELRELS